MKTSKRKRRTKAQPVIETVGADVVVAEMTGAAEPAVAAVAEPVAESSPAAVEALFAEPIVAAVVESSGDLAESAVEIATEPTIENGVAEQAADVSNEQSDQELVGLAIEVSIEQTADVVVEPPADVSIEQAAELVAASAVDQAGEGKAGASDETVVAESIAELVSESAQTVVAEVASEPIADAITETAEPVALGEPIVVLAANCSVKDAAALKTSLCAFSNHSDAVTLDISAVERVDTATMQLLCAFVRDRGGRNQSVSWRGESQALQDAVRLLGIGALLGLETKGVAA